MESTGFGPVFEETGVRLLAGRMVVFEFSLPKLCLEHLQPSVHLTVQHWVLVEAASMCAPLSASLSSAAMLGW